MEILTVPLDVLTPDPENPRAHPNENIAAITESLRRFGQVEPLVVHNDTSQVVAGNGRLQAMVDLGWTECEVVAYSGSIMEARALSIALNRTAETAAWDEANLASAVHELKEADFDDMGSLGFDAQTIEDLVALHGGDAEVAGGIDPYKEWNGMPSYEQEDKSGFRKLVVHFKDQESVDQFVELVGCKLTEKTTFIWFPEIEIETYADKRYESES